MIKIPADVDTPDKVLLGLSARQVAILAGTASTCYGLWQLLHPLVPALLAGVLEVPLCVAGVCLALLRRDGVPLDALARYGLAYRLRPRRLHGRIPPESPAGRAGHGGVGEHAGLPTWLTEHAAPAPTQSADGWDYRVTGARSGQLRLAAHGVAEHGWGQHRIGIIDLTEAGVAVIAACSTVNLALRSEREQHALLGCFARLLASTAGAVQIVVRTQPLDLSPTLAELDTATTELPHPALRAAAAAHRDYLADIAATGPLVRHVLLVLREPAPTTDSPNPRTNTRGGWVSDGGPARAAAVARLVGRLAEAARCMAPAEITVAPLDAATTIAVLASAADPDRPLDALTGHTPAGPPRTPTPYLAAEPDVGGPPDSHAQGWAA
jgi:hypothetical protein